MSWGTPKASPVLVGLGQKFWPFQPAGRGSCPHPGISPGTSQPGLAGFLTAESLQLNNNWAEVKGEQQEGGEVGGGDMRAGR